MVCEKLDLYFYGNQPSFISEEMSEVTKRLYIHIYTVEPRYLELAYFELPLISNWKSGPCFNMKLWQQVTK